MAPNHRSLRPNLRPLRHSHCPPTRVPFPSHQNQAIRRRKLSPWPNLRLQPPSVVQQGLDRHLQRLRPLALALRRRLERRVRPHRGGTRPSRAGERRPGVVLDQPVRAGDSVSQPALESRVSDFRAGICCGVLHPVLRWTRGGEVLVGESYHEGP